MSAGRFSWCPLLRRWCAKKQTKVSNRFILHNLTDNYVQEPRLEIVEVAEPHLVARISKKLESDEDHGVSELIHALCRLTSI
jgi:hypothetical protein